MLAEEAQRQAHLDAIAFIPTAHSPFKPDGPTASAAQRQAMLALALAPHPNWFVEPIELTQGGVNYTIDTLRTLKTHHPDTTFFWILGADALADVPHWRAARKLADEIEFLCLGRPGTNPPSSLPAWLRWRNLDGQMNPTSSTDIRHRLSQGEPIRHLLPVTVADYIEAHALYR